MIMTHPLQERENLTPALGAREVSLSSLKLILMLCGRSARGSLGFGTMLPETII
jgi:hypothetical protein